jgi:hypothetical protein
LFVTVVSHLAISPAIATAQPALKSQLVTVVHLKFTQPIISASCGFKIFIESPIFSSSTNQPSLHSKSISWIFEIHLA